MERLRDSFKPIVNRAPLDADAVRRRRAYRRRMVPLAGVALALGLVGALLGWSEGLAIAVALSGAGVFAWALGAGTDWRDEGLLRAPDRYDVVGCGVAAVLFAAMVLLRDGDPLVAAGGALCIGLGCAAWARGRRAGRAADVNGSRSSGD